MFTFTICSTIRACESTYWLLEQKLKYRTSRIQTGYFSITMPFPQTVTFKFFGTFKRVLVLFLGNLKYFLTSLEFGPQPKIVVIKGKTWTMSVPISCGTSFKDHKKKKQMVGITYLFKFSNLKWRPKRVTILTIKNGCTKCNFWAKKYFRIFFQGDYGFIIIGLRYYLISIENKTIS